jgi:hypothetical protein
MDCDIVGYLPKIDSQPIYPIVHPLYIPKQATIKCHVGPKLNSLTLPKHALPLTFLEIQFERSISGIKTKGVGCTAFSGSPIGDAHDGLLSRSYLYDKRPKSP